MAGSDDALSATGVTSGQFDEEGAGVLLTFDSAAGPFCLALPADQLMALLSVCIGLTGQNLPTDDAGELATIPLADWRVGVTAASAVVLGLAPAAGGALAFHLTPQQAQEIAAALGRGVQLAQAGDPPARVVRRGH